MKLTPREIELVGYWFKAAREYYEKYETTNPKPSPHLIPNLELYWGLRWSEKDTIDRVLDDLVAIAGCAKRDFKQLEKCWLAISGAENET